MLRVVLDTNIVVSALHQPDSDADIVMNLVLAPEPDLLQLCLSEEIWTEYQEMLSRPKFSSFDGAKIKALLAAIKQASFWVVPQVRVDLSRADPADNQFLACALAAQADFLITGNTRHFPKRLQTTRIVTLREFIEVEMIRSLLREE